MFRSVAVLLFGLAVVYAQIKPQPETVIVKKIYGNVNPVLAARGFLQDGPAPVAYQQPYPYQYQQGYYNQYQRAQYNPYAPAPVFASVAPPPAAAPFPVTPAPFVVKSAPQPIQYSGKTGVLDKDARVLSEERNVDFDGTFKYAFQTDNGIAVNAEGFVKQPTADSEGPIQVIQGSYTLYTPEGVPVQISYIADENGYRASGDAIPTPPPELAQAYANAPVQKQ